MEKIGRGKIFIVRKMPHDWKQMQDTIPTVTDLEIESDFTFESPYAENFIVESFDFSANFATVNFSGKLNMGFTSRNIYDHACNFKFLVPLFPTDFEAKVVVSLHYRDKKSGLRYTSHYRCNLGTVNRMDYTGRIVQHCYFDILNPSSSTFNSSEQAQMPDDRRLAIIPNTRRIDSTGQLGNDNQASGKSKTIICPSCKQINPIGNNFCFNCGHNFSQNLSIKSESSANKIGLDPSIQTSNTPVFPETISSPTISMEEPKRGCTTVGFGIFTLVSAILLILVALILFQGYVSIVTLLSIVNTAIGIYGGYTAITKKNKQGRRLCILFWVLWVVTILLQVIVS